MSKMKWSFSFILAIFLVGILSTAAFAASAFHMAGNTEYNLDGTPKDLKVTFNGKDANDIDGTSFTVKVTKKDVDGNYTVPVGEGTGVLDSTTLGQFHGLNKGQITVTGTYDFNTTYQVALYYTSDTNTPVEKAVSYFTDAKNAQMLNGDHGATKTDTNTVTLDKNGSGLTNANETGLNNTRKNRSGQKVHGFYQNNTNSCASCHQTHTGADSNLLFKDGVYSTCSACHDGTTGAYNSFAPVNEDNVKSIAGTFNVSKAHNGSIHEADGSLNVSAAPGGNKAGGQFNQEFDCASCHSPHGNGSASENNLNLDPLGWGTVAYGTSGDAQYGKLLSISKIYTEAETKALTAVDTPYILVKHTVTADEIGSDVTKQNLFFKRQSVVDPTLTAGTDVIMTYRWNGSKKYVADYSLWLREKGYPYKADTKLYKTVDTTTTEVTNLTVVWKDGFAYGTGIADVSSAKLSLGIDVETTDNPATLFDSKAVGFVPQSGTEMSKYCASCHTDYLSATRNDLTGKYTQAHRHQTATDELSCVRCHFGHGSEAQTMKTANDQTYYDLTATGGKFDATVGDAAAKLAAQNSAISYLQDPNPSSAIKRYTGMSVCFACHGQGEQFLGNPNNVDRPLTGKPGEEGRTAASPASQGNTNVQ